MARLMLWQNRFHTPPDEADLAGWVGQTAKRSAYYDPVGTRLRLMLPLNRHNCLDKDQRTQFRPRDGWDTREKPGNWAWLLLLKRLVWSETVYQRKRKEQVFHWVARIRRVFAVTAQIVVQKGDVDPRNQGKRFFDPVVSPFYHRSIRIPPFRSSPYLSAFIQLSIIIPFDSV